jgi:hypothetical protein
VDIVSQLLVYLSDVLPPSVSSNGVSYPDPKSIGKPDTLDPSYEVLIEDKMKAIELQDSTEKKALRKERPALPSQPVAVTSLSNFQTCRLLLSNLGFLTHKNEKKFLLLENGPRLLRLLKDLDQIHKNEVCKIGVLYPPNSYNYNAYYSLATWDQARKTNMLS